MPTHFFVDEQNQFVEHLLGCFSFSWLVFRLFRPFFVQVGSLWASQVRGYSYSNASANANATSEAAIPPAAPLSSPSPPPLPPREAARDRSPAGTATAAAVEAEEDDDTEWWRAGDGGGTAGTAAGGGGFVGQQHALMALEVLKPLMDQDLERLPDQVSGYHTAFFCSCITAALTASVACPFFGLFCGMFGHASRLGLFLVFRLVHSEGCCECRLSPNIPMIRQISVK